VFSDAHLYDKSLGTSGKGWVPGLGQDHKLFTTSEEVLRELARRIEAERPDFVLVTGDLTKDGERRNHELFVSILGGLAAEGIPSFVLPGNHDIDNPHAGAFPPQGRPRSVATATAAEFTSIYDDFGYRAAFSRDPASLSYAAEPVPGLVLVALDSAQYEENLAHNRPTTGGMLRPGTLAWLEGILRDSAAAGKTVFAAEHHPVMEHFDGMKLAYSEFVVAGSDRLDRLLASYGVRLVLTGHFHANSAAMRRWDRDEPGYPRALAGKFLVDAETGSLVTWPCPYRTVTIGRDASISVRTGRIGQLPSFAAAGRDFGSEAKAFLRTDVKKQASRLLSKALLPTTEVAALSDELADSILLHYAGDAELHKGEILRIKPTRNPVSRLCGRLVSGILKERQPSGIELMEDNDFDLSADGSWTRATTTAAAAGR
jgi:3',5'-cyclic AMP phosphodiesterase CpdA